MTSSTLRVKNSAILYGRNGLDEWASIAMVVNCAAVGCANRLKKGCQIKFFYFPQDATQRKQWIAAMCRDKWSPQEWDRLCSVHFVSGKPSKNPRDVDYIPSVFLFNKSPSRRAKQRTGAARFEKEMQRRIRAEDLNKKKRLSRREKETLRLMFAGFYLNIRTAFNLIRI